MSEAKTFRKKPVEIEAVRLRLDDNETVESVMRWAGSAVEFSGYDPETNRFSTATIATLEGTMRVSPGDWIIRGVQGEFYPCKPDIFEQTYEAA